MKRFPFNDKTILRAIAFSNYKSLVPNSVSRRPNGGPGNITNIQLNHLQEKPSYGWCSGVGVLLLIYVSSVDLVKLINWNKLGVHPPKDQLLKMWNIMAS